MNILDKEKKVTGIITDKNNNEIAKIYTYVKNDGKLTIDEFLGLTIIIIAIILIFVK